MGFWCSWVMSLNPQAFLAKCESFIFARMKLWSHKSIWRIKLIIIRWLLPRAWTSCTTPLTDIPFKAIKNKQDHKWVFPSFSAPLFKFGKAVEACWGIAKAFSIEIFVCGSENFSLSSHSFGERKTTAFYTTKINKFISSRSAKRNFHRGCQLKKLPRNNIFTRRADLKPLCFGWKGKVFHFLSLSTAFTA